MISETGTPLLEMERSRMVLSGRMTETLIKTYINTNKKAIFIILDVFGFGEIKKNRQEVRRN